MQGPCQDREGLLTPSRGRREDLSEACREPGSTTRHTTGVPEGQTQDGAGQEPLYLLGWC